MNVTPNTKRILCYGDSYTWGYIPSTKHERFSSSVRWTGVLQQLLGDEYDIIEEGLVSRTLNSDDNREGKEGRNGSTYLIPCLDTHDPIDLVILMLGTNELKDNFDTSGEEIATVVKEQYVKVITNRKSQFNDKTSQLLLISPPILNLNKDYAYQRYSKSTELNRSLSTMYNKITKKSKSMFINSAEYVVVGSDGVHLDEGNHKKLANAIYGIIKGK